VGLGSIRILFDKPELFHHFHIKPLAPDVPVLANIGGVQVRDLDHGALFAMVERLEVQALVVHLNPAQELFQPEGDRDFTGITGAIGRLCRNCPMPVIVKETGFGIHPLLARVLHEAGAAYVDVAGAGGTNWVTVEAYRLEDEEREAAEELAAWGIPTAVLLASLSDARIPVLASGGLRNGLDLAKSIALGAELAGMALPFIRAVTSGGVERALRLIRRLDRTLRTVMVLTGSKDLVNLRKNKLWMESDFAYRLESLEKALVRRSGSGDGAGPKTVQRSAAADVASKR
jgi:isopentenyl-diphosphate delta-isomerase type 2